MWWVLVKVHQRELIKGEGNTYHWFKSKTIVHYREKLAVQITYNYVETE